MKCINFQSPLSPLFSQHKISSFWLLNKPVRLRENLNGFSSGASVRTRAVSSSIFLATGTPPSPGNLSVLLQTSAVLLLAYWITNFVVPQIILKDLQSDKTDANGENPLDDERGNKPEGKT